MTGVQVGRALCGALRFYGAPDFGRLMIFHDLVGAVRVQAFGRMMLCRLRFLYHLNQIVALQCFARKVAARRLVGAKLVCIAPLLACPSMHVRLYVSAHQMLLFLRST